MQRVPRLSPTDLAEVCTATALLWDQMRQQRLFLTGGTGFFGCWLVETFLAANARFALGAEMTVLTRSPARFRERCPHLATEPAITLLEGDVRDFTFPEGDFPFVIHAATDTGDARTGPGANAALSTLSTIFDGTRRTLDFAAQAGTRRFLMVSSGAVYGPHPTGVTHIPETYLGAPDHLRPGSAYGEGKRAGEALCAAYASAGLSIPIARCFALVGPHLPLDGPYAIGNFIRAALDNQPIRIQGDGTPLRSYLYATDLVIWLWAMLVGGPSLLPLNVGSDEPISIRDLAETVRDVLNPAIAVEVQGLAKPGVPPSQYVPSIERGRTQMQLVPTVGLRDAVERTARWHGWTPAEPVDFHPRCTLTHLL